MCKKIKYQGTVAEMFQRNISSKKGSYRLPAGKLKEVFVNSRMNIFEAYNFGNNKHLSEGQFKALIQCLIERPEKGRKSLSYGITKGIRHLVPVYTQSEYSIAEICYQEDSEAWVIEIYNLVKSHCFTSEALYLYFE